MRVSSGVGCPLWTVYGDWTTTEVVRDAIETIMDENVRSGVIDGSLYDFFMQCNRTCLRVYPRIDLSPHHREEVLDAASSLFDELFDRIYYDVLEDDALEQAKREVDIVVSKPAD